MEFLFCISAIRDKNIMKILLNNTDDLFYILERRTKKEKKRREVMRSEILSIP